MGRLLALLIALVVGGLIAWTVEQPPKPLPPAAPPTDFSAARAMADVRAIAPRPHPIGADANHAARDYLVHRMSELGLDPQVRRAVAAYATARAPGVILGGEVENIVGVLPGRDRAAPAVALMAHYDSVPASSGAADDAAGVASALEAVRAIKAKGVPARDVMLIITDGEEAGLLGAEAFFKRDPLAKRVGFLINMEARGDAGRAQMFQTGAGNGETVRLLRKTATRPSANSLTVFVYEHMPNDTDFTMSKAVGVGGVNYAFIGRQFDYHSPSSTPATLDPGSLQDIGQQALAIAESAAFAPALPRKTPDMVYSQVLGDLVIAYPPAVGWLILAVSAALIAFGVARARRREAFPRIDILRGLGAGLFAVVGVVTLLHFARRATGASFGYLEQRALLAQANRWELALILLGLGFLLAAAAELARGRRQIALLPLLAGMASSLFGGFDAVGLGMGVVAAVLAIAAYGRPVSRAAAWSGVLTLGLVLALVAQILAPLAAFVIMWPLALAAIGAATTEASARRDAIALTILAGIAALGLGWIGGVAHAGYISLDLVEVLGLPTLLAAIVVWPLAQPAEGAPPERLIGPALIVVGLAVTAIVRFDPPWTPRFPQATYVQYLTDQDTGRAWRIRPRGTQSAWSDSVLGADGGRIQRLALWTSTRPLDAAPARPVAAPAATATLDRAPDGDLALHLAPPPGARYLLARLEANTPTTIVSVGGVPINLAMLPGRPTRLVWNNGPKVDVVLRPAGPGRLDVRTLATIDAWPATAKPLPPRPATLMPFDRSDTTVVAKSGRFTW